MENLDLATLGVEEMNEVQMVQTEGGYWGLVILGCAAMAAITYYSMDR